MSTVLICADDAGEKHFAHAETAKRKWCPRLVCDLCTETGALHIQGIPLDLIGPSYTLDLMRVDLCI